MVCRDTQYERDEGMTPEVAALLVQMTERFSAKLFLRCGGKQVLLETLIGLLSLDCPRGTRLTVVADGVDGPEAAEAVARLLEGRQGRA